MTTAEINSRKDLPEDIEQLRSFSWELVLAYKRLSEKYRKLLDTQFGRSSEKLVDLEQLDALQMEMDALLEQAMEAEKKCAEAERETVEVTSYRRRRKHPGRNALPEDLITEKTLDVSDAERICDCCGLPKSVIDTKAHVVVERIPARYEVTRYLRPVYACSHCKDTVSVAEPVMTPIAKGLAGPCLLVFVMVSKYVYHLPLYRIQRQIFHESGGIWFTRSTLSGWVGQICAILERIHRALLDQYRASRIKHADESPLSVMCDKKLRTGWMWVGLSGDGRTAVFVYDRHRSGKAALKLLEGSSAGDYLMIDDCASYHKVIDKLKLVDQRCMVHIRRKFVDARKAGSQSKYVDIMLIKIGQLYRIERLARNTGCSNQQRLVLRRKYSAEIMRQIKSLLDNPGFAVLPQSTLGSAILHFRKNWDQACRFLESGELPIDNSANERIIRPFAIGRNNWLQAGSENGARWMATLYSICTTCKLNNIDVNEYLADVIMRLPLRPANADISDLTPVGWYRDKHNGDMPPVTHLYPSKN